MSQIPPPGGWIDPYGTPQPGYPPPGYWQASDGRWYPPESRPGQPFASAEMVAAPQLQPQAQPQPGPYGAPGGPPPPGTSQPYGAAPQPQFGYPGQPTNPLPSPAAPPSGGNRTGLWIALGVVGALIVVAIGVVALRGGADTTASSTTTTAAPTPTTTSAVSSTTGTVTTRSASATSAAGSSKEKANVQACSLKPKGKIEVDLTSKVAAVSDFTLTIALLDDSAKRVGDTTAYIEHLRPGERTVEEAYVLDEKGTKCEVISVEDYDVKVDPALLADVSACTAGKPDSLGYFNATLTATNSGKVNSDYNITVAIIDSKGVRRGSGSSLIKAIRPKETAPGDIFTSVSGADGATCEVVGVDRSDS